MILAGDIGGTKTVLALYEPMAEGLRLVRDGTYPSQAHASLEEIIRLFLAGDAPVSLRAGCFGVAGPVLDGKSQTTNLPWHLEETRLAQACAAPQVKLLNDLEAAAYGMLHLQSEELVALNPKAPNRCCGNVVVIAAGTGLGEALLYWDGRRYHPLASEGGHADLAPRNEREIELLRWLQARHGHVSYERVLSGPGLFNVFAFLRDSKAFPESPALKAALAAGGDASAVVSRLGVSGEDALCRAAVEMFCEMYGAEAGNLVLKCMAVGGVFVGGGIAPHLMPILQSGGFLRGFLDKGRFGALLEAVPIHVALNPRAPLLGAAHYAAQMT